MAVGGTEDATETLSRPAAANNSISPGATPAERYNSPEVLARLPNFKTATNRYLFFWMFGFLRPVKRSVFAACMWLALAVGVEIFVAKWIEKVVNLIQKLYTAPQGHVPSFWQWFWRDSASCRGIVSPCDACSGRSSDRNIAAALSQGGCQHQDEHAPGLLPA